MRGQTLGIGFLLILSFAGCGSGDDDSAAGGAGGSAGASSGGSAGASSGGSAGASSGGSAGASSGGSAGASSGGSAGASSGGSAGASSGGSAGAGGSGGCALTGTNRPFAACCTDNAQCTSGLCFKFGDGTQVCTQTCGSDADCPAGSQGKKCNNQKVCRP